MTGQLPNGKTWLMVLQFILPVVLAIGAGYGTVQYAAGDTNRALLDLERRVKAQEESINRLNERAVTREELRQFIESTKSDLSDIKTDIRYMRTERR